MLAIPYMGSKRKIAPQIVDFIHRRHKKAKYFYDVFGGGGAVSFYAIQQHYFDKVVYNELNTGVVELLRKIVNDGVTDDFFKWVSRDEFQALKDGNCWRSGLVKTCWSFGNNQSGYLFGEDIEEPKRLLHEMIINNCMTSRAEFKKLYGLNIELNEVGLFGVKEETITQKRIRIMKQVKNHTKGKYELQQLEQLEQLERPQQLEQLEQLEILNLSYEKVEFDTEPSETIIYLDPPYFNTAKYQESIDHDEFYNWVEELKNRGFNVYISSYESHLDCVLEIEHNCTLSPTANNKVIEKLFYAN